MACTSLQPPVRAIIYARYSTYEQREGATLARQLGDCRKLCGDKGWSVEAELIDAGLSAFTGKNREEGAALAEFVAEALAGLHSGKTLVVERLDRLSRQGHDDTYRLVTSLTAAGVSVSVVDGDELYLAGTRLELIQVITMLIKAEVAHEESAKKSQRILDAKARKRAAARETNAVFSRWGPWWLQVVNGKWEEVPERVQLAKDIFDMADLEGAGKTIITRWLNENHKPWSKGQGWHESFVARLLSNRAVLGECQFTKKVEGKQVPDGEPLQGYYPPIIHADQFARVNQNAPARKDAAGGRKDPTIANLFSGLIRCAVCGGTMRYGNRRGEGAVTVIKGKSYVKKHADAYLVCSQAYRAVPACGNRAKLAYHSFETAILGSILHIAMDDQSFSNRDEVGRLTRTIAERQNELDSAMAKAERLWNAWAEESSNIATTLARKAEADAECIRANLDALKQQQEAARGRVSSAEHLARVADIRAKLYHADMAVRVPLRRKVAQAFGQVITSIAIDANRTSTITVAKGLAIVRLDRKGKLLTGPQATLNRKEYQLDVLRSLEGNAGRVDAILGRDMKKRKAA